MMNDELMAMRVRERAARVRPGPLVRRYLRRLSVGHELFAGACFKCWLVDSAAVEVIEQPVATEQQGRTPGE